MLKNKPQPLKEEEIYNYLANPEYLKSYLEEINQIERTVLKRMRQNAHTLPPDAFKSLANTLDFLQNQKERIIKILKETTQPPQETFTELPQQIKILLLIDEILKKTYQTSILDIITEALQQKFNLDISEIFNNHKSTTKSKLAIKLSFLHKLPINNLSLPILYLFIS